MPVASRYEHADEYPQPLVERMKELGLFGATIPVEYGGLGLDYSTYSMIVEELCRGWMSLSGVLNTHLMFAYVLGAHGTREQKERYLPAMARGEHRAALCLTEPHAGSDTQRIRTTARRQGDHYVVNGSKMFITNARTATIYSLVVKTDPSADPPHPPRGRHEGPRRALRPRGGHGKALRLGGLSGGVARGDACPRGVRLHQGVPGRALLSRRAAHDHRRGHQRDPAPGDRPQPGAAVQDLRPGLGGQRRALAAVALLAAVSTVAGLRWRASAPRVGASPEPPGSAEPARPASSVAPLALPAHARVVVFAPHPDDETVGVGGLLFRLAHGHTPLRVVFVTNGDGYRRALEQDFAVERPTDADYVALGELRRREALAALDRQ